MKRVVFWMTALVIAMFWAMTVQAQESQDSIESVNKAAIEREQNDARISSAEREQAQQEVKLVALQEVVIKGGLPNTRLKAGAMVTRIEGTPLAQSGTLGEMLIKVPGMTGSDEAPEVLGKGSPLIYINGRKMRDASELKRLHSEDIRDVEVINAPGAQYDAQVRAVVRIRTRKQQGDGLSLNATLFNEHDLRYDFDRPQVKLGANYRAHAVGIFGSIYYYHQDYRSRMLLLSNTLTSTNLSIRSVPISLSHLVSASGRSMLRQALRSRTFTSTSQVQAAPIASIATSHATRLTPSTPLR
jgi:hypothetical protein